MELYWYLCHGGQSFLILLQAIITVFVSEYSPVYRYVIPCFLGISIKFTTFSTRAVCGGRRNSFRKHRTTFAAMDCTGTYSHRKNNCHKV